MLLFKLAKENEFISEIMPRVVTSTVNIFSLSSEYLSSKFWCKVAYFDSLNVLDLIVFVSWTYC